MASINDILITTVNGAINAQGVNFGVPVLIGFTGSLSIVKWGSGVSAIVAKSVIRNDNLELKVTEGTGYTYAISGDEITITFPASARVRDLIADFNANAPAAVKSRVTLQALGTGSGVVNELETAGGGHVATSFLTYQKIISLEQIEHFYDNTDKEYRIIRNILSSTPSPNVCYLLNAFGVTDANLETFITPRDTGEWFCVLTTATAESTQQALADYVNARDRIALFTSSAIGRLDAVKGDHIAYLIHDAANDHPEASWAAKCLPFVPTVGWKFQRALQGQTPNLTASISDLLTVRAKKGNSYVQRAGQAYVDGSQINSLSDTLYLDGVIGRLWIKLNLESDLLTLFLRVAAQGSRIPYTDKGIEQIKAVIGKRLTDAGRLGIIAPVETEEQAAQSFDGQYRYRVTSLTRAEIEDTAPGDIIARVLSGVRYSYIEAGAIEKLEITGIILLTEN